MHLVSGESIGEIAARGEPCPMPSPKGGSAPVKVCFRLATATFLAACSDLTAPVLPPAVLLQPPAVYRSWWRQVEECSGRTADFTRTRFYTVIPTPNEDSLYFRDPRTGQYLDGEWVPSSNAIYLAAGQVTNPGVVRHEMLHAILREIGHPARYFADRCAVLVAY